VLAQSIAAMISPGWRIVDVGCGDGRLAALVCQAVPDLKMEGVEVRPRQDCVIPYQTFDGITLPFPDRSVDCCLFVDVLHHIGDPLPVLRDACRISSKFVIVKDHLAENSLDHWTLRFMDWVGNRAHGVAMPYNYLSRSKWQALYSRLGLDLVRTDTDVRLYRFPFSTVFGRNLHFISLLEKNDPPV
jgi:ubiquinone/menaquinone biosynthesis C-methylase UbiE